MSYNPNPKIGLGCYRFARHYYGNRFFFLFLLLLRCFSSQGCSQHNYVFIMWYQHITVGEFPHSDISGSMFAYNSPKHFVVCHVLHQLLMPRHSPYALINLTTINCFPNWWVFEILMQFSWTENCYSNVIFISLINITHYLVFKEQNLRENNLSKPSKISISSQLKSFDFRPNPRRFHTVVFL